MVHSFPLARTLYRLSCVFSGDCGGSPNLSGVRCLLAGSRVLKPLRRPCLSSHKTSLPDEQRPLGCRVGAISAIIPPRPDQSRPCGPVGRLRQSSSSSSALRFAAGAGAGAGVLSGGWPQELPPEQWRVIVGNCLGTCGCNKWKRAGAAAELLDCR